MAAVELWYGRIERPSTGITLVNRRHTNPSGPVETEVIDENGEYRGVVLRFTGYEPGTLTGPIETRRGRELLKRASQPSTAVSNHSSRAARAAARKDAPQHSATNW
jgi:hypothetical protein